MMWPTNDRRRRWMLLMPMMALLLSAPACDVLVELIGQGNGAGPAPYGRGGVYLQIDNQSGFRVAVEATYSYDGMLVRQTTRWLPASGPEATETVLLTDADQITVTAYAAETVTGILQEGDVLAQNHYVLGTDYLAGGTLVFEVPVVDTPPPSIIDCNENGIADAIDIADGTSPDCDQNGVPDECDVTDDPSIDCNHNGVPDSCDIEDGYSLDRNGNGTPDECEAAALLLELDSQVLAPEQAIDAKVWLLHPAGAGGVAVHLGSEDTGVADVTPEDVVIPEGQYGADFAILGIAPGMTEVFAEAPGLNRPTAAVTVTEAAVILPAELQVAPDETIALPVSLSVPASEGGVTVNLESGHPGIASVDTSVHFPAGSQVPIANPRIYGHAFGEATITATAPGFASATCDVTVTIDIDFVPGSVVVKEGETVQLRLHMSAPLAGLVLHFSTDAAAIATVGPTITTDACETCTVVTVTGVLEGTTTLRAWADGVEETIAIVDVVATPEIVLGDLIVGDGLETAHPYFTRWLGMAAPAGGVDVTLTSDDPTRVRLAIDPEDAGTTSIVLHVPAGDSLIPEFFVQGFDDGLFNTQPVPITASAPGYNEMSFDVALAPSGFAITYPGDFTTTPLSDPQEIWVQPVCLDKDTFSIIEPQLMRGMSPPVGVDLSGLGRCIGQLSVNPVVFYPGMDMAITEFTPLCTGDADITLDPVPGGEWQIPSEAQEITVTIVEPTITISAIGVGKHLQHAHPYYSRRLSKPAPMGGTAVMLTVDNDAMARLSTDPAILGSGSISVTVPEGQTQIPTFYVQGLMESGTTNVTVTAPAFAPTSFIVTLYPSGFYISSPGVGFDTTPYSGNTNVTIKPARLDPATQEVMYDSQAPAIRGGLANVVVSAYSSVPSVGTILGSPTFFSAGDTQKQVAFQPLSWGLTTIMLSAPGGFTTPSEGQQVIARVLDPTIDLSDDAVGKDLQVLPSSSYRRLSTNAAEGGVDVTLTSQDPSKVLLSNDPALAGSGTLVLHVPEGSRQIPDFFIQGLADFGTVTVTASAPDHDDGSFDVTLFPSGFAIDSPSSINTTAFSNSTAVKIRPARLAAGTLTLVEWQAVRGGMETVDVPVTSSQAGVGTMLTSPAEFQAGMSEVTSDFDPIAAGTTIVSIDTPTGFATPATRQEISAAVGAPKVFISSGDVTVGLGLQTAVSVSLESAPPAPVDVVVTSCTDTIVTLSKDRFAAGTQSVVFQGVTSSYVGTVYVQGRGLSCTRIVAEAAGYEEGRCHVTVAPAGFYISWPYEDFLVDVSTNSLPIEVSPAWLDLSTLFTQGEQEVHGGSSIAVEVRSSDTVVGTIAESPLTFEPGNIWETTDFTPLSVGDTEIQVFTPAGFVTPANGQMLRVTVVDESAQGACCFPEGWCEVMQADICVGIGGTYAGDGVACDPSPCSQPSWGACCVDGTMCVMKSESDCINYGGIYVGDGTSCDDSPCEPQPVGACCMSPIGCAEVPELVCIQGGGYFVGIGVQCGPTTCE